MSLCLDRAEFSERLAASRAVYKDGELVRQRSFFCPCAPHTASTSGQISESAEQICMSPELVGLTWITDRARPLMQAVTLSQAHTYMHIQSPIQHGQSMKSALLTDITHDRKLYFFKNVLTYVSWTCITEES